MINRLRNSPKLWAISLFVFIVILPSTQANEAETHVSYTRTADGFFVVDTFVDGQGPFPFLIDTGATTSVLTDELHQKLDTSQNSDVSLRIHGIAESGVFPRVMLKSIKVGELEIRPVQVAVMPSVQEEKPWEGILSLDFFEGRIAHFQTRTNTLTLMPSSDQTRAKFAKWRKMKAYRDETLADYPFIFFNTTFVTESVVRATRIVDRESVEALLDLGSSVPIINWAGAKHLGYGNTYSKLRKQWEVDGAVGAFEPKAQILDQSIVVGRKRWTTPILIFDTPPLKLINRTEKPFMYFSANFFKSMDFAIDFAAPEVYFSPH